MSAGLGAWVLLGVGVLASPLPVSRPDPTLPAAVQMAPAPVRDDRTILEMMLGDQATPTPSDAASDAQFGQRPVRGATLRAAPVPAPRPAGIKAMARSLQQLSPDEMVCRDPRLKGTVVRTVAGRLPGCVIVDPVRVTQISGITLSRPATLNCPTARSFANWLTGIADPAAKEFLGSRIQSVRIMGSYSCRTRNNRPGARLSEHAGGRAIDIGGVTLANGRVISVLKNWGKGADGRFLRRIWKRACGPFKTVLGPDGDRFHRDHLHFDSARRRSTFCR